MPLASDDDLTDDAIAGDYRVYQRLRGHRYSLDDVATAWEAAQCGSDAERVLDLGCGIGSVLTMLAYRIPGARIHGVEAQAISFALATRNVERNGLAGRVTLHLGDLRDTQVLAATTPPFGLVTGTPPYFPATSGTLSPDSQRAHARAELRGGVEDYVVAMGRVLAEGGRAVVCADARFPERVTGAATVATLHVRARRDVIPRADHKGPLFTVFTLAREFGPEIVHPPLVARDRAGARTESAHALRRFFGLPANELEAPSPGKRP